jgi:IclR family transcriptional regulator, pca regulon regulatory protein
MSMSRTDNPQSAWNERGHSVPSLREPRFSQSLERGLAILACFSGDRPVLGIADLADELGMSRSTTHRYVVTLVALGYLEQDASRKYRLGLRVTDLGMSALGSMGLREHAHPFLVELRRESGFSCGVGVLDGVEVLFVDRVRGFRRGQHVVDVDLHAGGRVGLGLCAAGWVLLSFLPDGELRGLVGRLEGVSRRGWRGVVEGVRGEGLAVFEGGGVVGVAAPVRGEGGEVVAVVDLVGSAVVVSGDELARSWGAPLIATAARISARLGYRHAHQRN